VNLFVIRFEEYTMNKEKLRFAILKEISIGNKSLTEVNFEITSKRFDEEINFLSREIYLKGFFWVINAPCSLRELLI